MKLFVRDGYLIEAFRYDDVTNARHHFVECCGWTEDQFSEIEDFDFYAIEIVATKLDELTVVGSASLGACCSENWAEDVESGLGGYLEQLIGDAIEDAEQ